MSPTRIAAVALLVAVAGCAGLAPTDGGETTSNTTEPHTAVGTSHAGSHLTVRASAGVENVSVTLAPGGDTETYDVPAGSEVDLTRKIHNRGHDVRVVVERGDEVVYDATVRESEYHQLVVHANDTDVTMAVV